MSNTQKFQIDIWFDQAPNKIKLGTVSIYADSQEKAMELARVHTEYELSGVDTTAWQVHEESKIIYEY